MATYAEIQKLVKQRHGITVKTCWIADVKEQLGMPMRKAPNRQGQIRIHPCPPEKRAAILQAIADLA
jgi:hypothetical protein